MPSMEQIHKIQQVHQRAIDVLCFEQQIVHEAHELAKNKLVEEYKTVAFDKWGDVMRERIAVWNREINTPFVLERRKTHYQAEHKKSVKAVWEQTIDSDDQEFDDLYRNKIAPKCTMLHEIEVHYEAMEQVLENFLSSMKFDVYGVCIDRFTLRVTVFLANKQDWVRMLPYFVHVFKIQKYDFEVVDEDWTKEAEFERRMAEAAVIHVVDDDSDMEVVDETVVDDFVVEEGAFIDLVTDLVDLTGDE